MTKIRAILFVLAILITTELILIIQDRLFLPTLLSHYLFSIGTFETLTLALIVTILSYGLAITLKVFRVQNSKQALFDLLIFMSIICLSMLFIQPRIIPKNETCVGYRTFGFGTRAYVCYGLVWK
jgi:hypothetical protein